MSNARHRRPPGAPRRGAQPRGRALRPPRRLPPLRAGAGDGRAGGGVARDRDIAVIRSSPLERAQETAAPLAAALGLEVGLDERIIESTNLFEGKTFGRGRQRAAQPAAVAAPLQPVPAVVGRALPRDRRPDDGRRRTTYDARRPATRPCWSPTSCRSGPPGCSVEGRSFLHDPRRRQCTLCSVTSFHFVGRPAGAGLLQRARDRPDPEGRPRAPFSAGDAPEEVTPGGERRPDELKVRARPPSPRCSWSARSWSPVARRRGHRRPRVRPG